MDRFLRVVIEQHNGRSHVGGQGQVLGGAPQSLLDGHAGAADVRDVSADAHGIRVLQLAAEIATDVGQNGS